MAAAPRSAMEIELNKLSTPRIFLFRMLVFLVACGLVAVVLNKQIQQAFFANPGLNALIGLVLFFGILLSFRQVIRLYPEVSWVNNFRIADPGLAIARHPTLLAPMAAKNLAQVYVSVTTLDHEIARRMEPRASAAWLTANVCAFCKKARRRTTS